jgi:lysophospholipase L1-like esterase
MTLRRAREIVEDVVRVRADPHLQYLDGLALFGPGDASDLPDDLHPNAAGYQRMGERFHQQVFVDGPWAAAGARS